MILKHVAAFALLALPAISFAQYPCDAAGEDENRARIMEVLANIDVACPLYTPSRSDYKRCVKDELSALETMGEISHDCQKVLSAHAKRSTVGRPASRVCCRVRTSGGVSHKVVREASQCVDSSRYTTCQSSLTSTVAGCDGQGCAPPVCGNLYIEQDEDCDPPVPGSCTEACTTYVPGCGSGIVDPGEECEPPGTFTCSNLCMLCETVDPLCGNLVVDAGETCDPPGIGACGPDCQAAPCAAAAPGETDVACVAGTATVSAAGSASKFLITWDGQHGRDNREILGRRFAHDLTPLDTTLDVLTADRACGSNFGGASTASNGSDFFIGWVSASSDGVPSSPSPIRARRVDGTTGVGAVFSATQPTGPFPGVCNAAQLYKPPVRVGKVASSEFALSWLINGPNCGHNTGAGVTIDDSGAVPVGTQRPVGYGAFGLTNANGTSGVDSLAGSTLWVSHAGTPPPTAHFLSATWTEGLTNVGPFAISSGLPYAGAVPAVSAGDSSFLVAWRQGSTPTMTEIRAIRVTRASGRIDPDGGILLAEVPGGITGGVSAAFDGSLWLVAWTEASMSGNDLRAVAVETDGTVVDGSPRLLASSVAAQEPALAGGNGEVLVAFRRDDSGYSAIRSLLVVP